MERHVEVPPDQVDDPPGTPEIGAEAVLRRLLGQPRLHLLLLGGSQIAGPSRRGPGGQAQFSGDPVTGHPLGHRHGVDAQCDGDRGLGPSVEDHLNRPSPHGFQFGSRSFASHARR